MWKIQKGQGLCTVMISSCAGRDGVDVIALYAAMYI